MTIATPRPSKEAMAPAATTAVRTSGRGRLLHAASAPAPSDEFSQTEEVGEKERATAFASFEAALQEVLELRKGHMVEAALLNEQDSKAVDMGAAVVQTWEAMARGLEEATISLRRDCADAGRKQTKSSKAIINLKLATVRTAAREHTSHVRVELEAKAEEMVKRAIYEMMEDGGKALMDAHAQIDQLKEEVKEAKEAVEVANERVRDAQSKTAAVAGKLAKTEHDLTVVNEEKAEAKTTLEGALRDLGVLKDENQTLSQQLRMLLDAFEDSKNEAAMLRKGNETALRRRYDEADVVGMELRAVEGEFEEARTAHDDAIHELERALRKMTRERDAAKEAAEAISSGGLDALQRARDETEALQEQIEACEDLLRRTIPNREGWDLAQHISALIREFEARGDLVGQWAAVLDGAPKAREPQRGEATSLVERTSQLAEDCAAARQEEEACRRAMDTALLESATLTSQVTHLLSQVADLTATLQGLQGGAMGQELRKAQQELMAQRDQVSGLQKQVMPLRLAVEQLTADNARLGVDYYSVREALDVANATIDALAKKLDWTTKTAHDRIKRTDEAAVAKVHAVEEHARRERSKMITSAVHALQALGTHLTQTLVGLRVTSVGAYRGEQLLQLIAPTEPLMPNVRSPPNMLQYEPRPPSTSPPVSSGGAASAEPALPTAPPATPSLPRRPLTSASANGSPSPRSTRMILGSAQTLALSGTASPLASPRAATSGGASRRMKTKPVDFTHLPELLTTPNAVFESRNGPPGASRPQTAGEVALTRTEEVLRGWGLT